MKTCIALVALALAAITVEANLQVKPRTLKPRRRPPLLSALSSALGATLRAADQDCGGQTTSCADCSNVLTCTKIAGVFEPVTTTVCPTSTPYCSQGTCVAQLTSDDECNKPPVATDDFECFGDGYFPSPSDCSKYYLCVDKVPYEYDCTQYTGTYYEQAIAMCGLRAQATCASVTCPAAQLGKYQLWKQDSSIYFVCTDTTPANAYVAACGENRQIDATTGNCVLTCQREGRLPHESDNKKYYECVKTGTTTFSSPTPGTCPGSSTFDKATERCTTSS